VYDEIYYEKHDSWHPEDYYALWRYLSRLFQYVGPTPAQAANPTSNSARIQAKKTGRRDDELAAMDVPKMPVETRYLAKHLLIHQMRFDLALERFPNLRPLEQVGDLGRKLYLDSNPKLVYDYLTRVGILL